MNSSMLAGERRWASARRGGMTVLGKVAVPKPLNLPSQRLENHGLDPNVEIVPKGTLSWGSRPSSSGSNPWISSSVSPNGDGGTVSPSHLSGRPSSGGSGTRPSTAGSDRTHEPVANAWGSNSRPSSSSGTMSSNQTSTSLRPRSAENRPNSSQLSRFADPVSKSSAAWSPSTTAERLGVKSSKEDGFSLSSGDFPTLGSEKDNSVKHVESEDHSRPGSASGRLVQAKEDAKSQADLKRGNLNTWRADGPRNAEDDIHPNMEKRQGDPHQYFNMNAQQHFDAWRGPPMNGPAGVWYGGRPQGPGFGPPVAPGGFPMEPFPYYRPQIGAPPLAGSQQVPPPGAGPRGPRPKNGDLYRPQMPDAYGRPGVPFRPGFYPGPPGPMAFEGYYGAPMGYCSERDMPYMGMAAGPPVYNGYPAPASDIGNTHGRPVGHVHAGKTLLEHVDADHLEDTHGPKRVPLRNHNERDQREEGESLGHKIQPNASYPAKSRYPTIYSRKNEWGAEEDTEDAIFANRSENSSHGYEHKVHATDSMKVQPFEGMGNVRTVNDNWTNKSESLPSFPPDMPQLPISSEKESSGLAPTKNSNLMHKIDGLNAKHRASDIQNDAPGAYNREEERNGSQIVDVKTNNYPGGVNNTAGSFERTPVSVPHEVTVPVGDEPIQPMAVMSRRPYHGGQGRVEHRGKGKFNSQDADGWRRKPLMTASSNAVTATSTESALNIHLHGPNVVGEASENSIVNSAGKTEGDSAEIYDSTDTQAQRAKARELAKQRGLQLQKEEEERIREQKAKALAKLEELNRRTLVEAVDQKEEKTQAIGDVHREQEESCALAEFAVADVKFQEPGFYLVSNTDVTAVDRDKNANQDGESVEASPNLPLKMQRKGLVESNVSPLPMLEEAHDGAAIKVVSQFNDGGFSRHKRPGYKQKQNHSLQKSMNEKFVSNVASEAQKDRTQVSTIDISSNEGPSSEIKPSESNVPNTSDAVVEPSTHQRRKSNRSGKNKHKLDETPAVPALPPVMSNINLDKESIETGESKDSLTSNLDGSISTRIEPDRGVQTQEVLSYLPNEESQSKGSNQGKPGHSRRVPRNQQGTRFMDKLHGSDAVVWAPVRTQNKGKGPVEVEVEVEDYQRPVQESANTTKGENMAQNSSKGKRAEIERYVPKPVAKELAQQGSIPPSLPTIISSRSDEGAGSGREQSGLASSASLEINEDGSHHKHKKDHGMWRPRGSTDSSHTKVVHGPSSTSEATKDIQQSKELDQSVKTETNSATAETKASSNVDVSDGHNMTNTTTAAASKYPLAKDQGATGRGKRHLPRGSKSFGNNLDSDNTFSGGIDGNSAAPDVNQTDRTVVSKERSSGERASHWQPKSQPNSANSQHGNRITGSESVTEVNRLRKKDYPEQKVQVSSRRNNEGGNLSQSQPGQSVNVKTNVSDESSGGHYQEFDREKKPALAKGRPYSPNPDPVGSGESAATANKDDQLERNIPSGSRRNGRQNNRSSRGHESRIDWSSGHDHRPHDIHAFRDRQRQNVHYEYQPVGPSKGKKAEMVEETRDGADSMDQRHRERGHNHSKRGGYRRQNFAARVDSGRDN